MRVICAGACLLALAGCSSGERAKRTPDFAGAFEVAPHVRLWIACSGNGPVVLADGGLGTPTQAWAGVRRAVRHVRFCAFDRAGVGRSDVRSCHCGSLERNVEDVHALIKAAHLRTPVVLVGHSTGGLDALLYARRHRADVAGLVLVDSPSEAAPPPRGPLADGDTRLEFASGLRELRRAGRLDGLPILVLSHGRRTFATPAAERSWSRMQRQLTADSSDTLRVIAADSGHLIERDQPGLVAKAGEQMVTTTQEGRRLRCLPVFEAVGGRCSP
jgi:pimeloyl-ACP methyl ester carboxylesterase